jgi:hypothetical protein
MNVTKKPIATPPPALLDKIKAYVSPKSTAGVLRDRGRSVEDQLKKAGA